jgi:hypothetical protein
MSCCAFRPRGLGTTVPMLNNVCRDDDDATDLIDGAVRNPVGTNQHVGVDNINRLRRPDGTSRDHALRRLRDQRPDQHALVMGCHVGSRRYHRRRMAGVVLGHSPCIWPPPGAEQRQGADVLLRCSAIAEGVAVAVQCGPPAQVGVQHL